jgi:hypothetical protein
MNGVSILSVTENLDNSPESVMLESCLEGMAQYYSLNLSREVMKGMTESAYQCTHLGGIPPLGYDVDPVTRKYVVNEAEADIISRIVRLVSESDVSIATVKADLKRLEERKICIEKYLEDARVKKKLAIISEDTLVSLIHRSKDYVKTRNIAECRNFIESYIEKVLVFDDRVEVIFKINVPDEAQEAVTTLKSEERVDILKKEYRQVV